MRWYGSLQNRLLEMTKSQEPVIGMGATEIYYSDRKAFEVIEVKDERHVTVRRLKTNLVGSYYGQDYTYESDPNGITKNLYLTKSGKWKERIGRQYGNVFFVGHAEEYEDPTF